MFPQITNDVMFVIRGRWIEERSAFSAKQVVCTGGSISSKAVTVSRQFWSFSLMRVFVLFCCCTIICSDGLLLSSLTQSNPENKKRNGPMLNHQYSRLELNEWVPHARKDADTKLTSPDWRRIKPGTWRVSLGKALKIKLIIENASRPLRKNKEPIKAQLIVVSAPFKALPHEENHFLNNKQCREYRRNNKGY